MKNYIPRTSALVIIAFTVLWAGSARARAEAYQVAKAVATSQASAGSSAAATSFAAPAVTAVGLDPADTVVIETVEPSGKSGHSKTVAWLGLAVGEASEALSSQLGLKPGE